MTHASIPAEERAKLGISDSLVSSIPASLMNQMCVCVCVCVRKHSAYNTCCLSKNLEAYDKLLNVVVCVIMFLLMMLCVFHHVVFVVVVVVCVCVCSDPVVCGIGRYSRSSG